MFSKVENKNKKIFIIGDFNSDSLNYSSNTKVKRFIYFMFSKCWLLVINRPTRVTKNTSSCIDHIYITSYFTENISTGI